VYSKIDLLNAARIGVSCPIQHFLKLEIRAWNIKELNSKTIYRERELYIAIDST